ncbi:MAG: hypothetical protein KGI50_07435 [Patescibacteria group bacterium]|nr:hypothetical protein [Patescibacteria group bacterium]MDE2438789.1 hypothetical protein [Patescibacteria group bacterium]
MLEKYLNKFVKVLPSGAEFGRHPTKERYIQVGDILYIGSVGTYLTYKCIEGYTQDIQADMVEILDNNKYVGKDVRFVDPNYEAYKPVNVDVERLLVGDIVKITICNEHYIGYVCEEHRCTEFGEGFNQLKPEHVELCVFCMCKSLLFGHEFGCPMFKGY